MTNRSANSWPPPDPNDISTDDRLIGCGPASIAGFIVLGLLSAGIIATAWAIWTLGKALL